MTKYIIELNELPNNCSECPLVSYNNDDIMSNSWCGITGESMNTNCRGENCPIKIIETE